MTKIFIVVILLMGGIGYWYYQNTQAILMEQAQQIAGQKAQISAQNEAIEKQKEDIAQSTKLLEEANAKFADSRKSVEDLQSKFNKVSSLLGARDIGKMAAAKPGSIERIIDKGTEQVMRCFEIFSGQPLTKKEENAEKPSQINKACTSIANPKYISN